MFQPLFKYKIYTNLTFAKFTDQLKCKKRKYTTYIAYDNNNNK